MSVKTIKIFLSFFLAFAFFLFSFSFVSALPAVVISYPTTTHVIWYNISMGNHSNSSDWWDDLDVPLSSWTDVCVNTTYAAKAGTGICSAGEVVQNTTTSGVDCVTVSGLAETDPLWSANYSIFNTSWSSTYNVTYAAKAGTGDCPSGQIVMNTTASGVECIVPPAGDEVDPIFVAENTTLWNAINSKLEEADQRYNDTTLILAVNTTSNIMSLEFYNKSEVDNLLSGEGNASWNQSLADTLYYSITNPSNFINLTTGQDFNDTTLILTVNTSLWTYISNNESAWLSTYNATYEAKAEVGTCPAGEVVQNTTTSGVECIVPPAGDEVDPLWTGNFSLVAFLANQGDWNVNSSIYWAGLTAPMEAWNSTYNATYEAKAGTGTCSAGEVVQNTTASGVECVAPTLAETDPLWTGNSTLVRYKSENVSWYNISEKPTHLSNFTDDLGIGDNTSWNQSLADTLYSTIDEPLWTGNYTAKVWNASGFILNWNSSGLIIDWNSSGFIINWSEVITGGDNTSWNESYADTLYSPILWAYNQTTATFEKYSSVWNSTYNATYEAKAGTGDCSPGEVVMNTTSSGVECVAPSLTESDPLWTGNQSSYSTTATILGWNYWNDTFATFNKTYADTLYSTIAEPLWSGNYTAFNSSWSSTYNATYATWAYNQTSPALTYTDTMISTADLHTHACQNITGATSDLCTIIGGNSSWNQSLADTLYAPISVTGDNTSWNESYADTLYSSILWAYNQTEEVYDKWGKWFYNMTTPAIEWTQAQSYLTSYTETDPLWSANYSLFNSSWSSTYNATYAPWAYNQTTPAVTSAATYTDTQITLVNTTGKNLTLGDKITFALGEIIDNIVDGIVKITGDLFVSGDINATNINSTNLNVSDMATFNKINATGNLTMGDAVIYWNGTALIIKVN